MGIREDIALFEAKLNSTIDEAMEGQVFKTTKFYITSAVEEEVYDKYPNPVLYERKRKEGGLTDPSNIEIISYDKATHTLEVANTRTDGRKNVVEIVESGEGYMYKPGPASASDGAYLNPRPFHKEAEERIKQDKVLETILDLVLSARGFDAKRN